MTKMPTIQEEKNLFSINGYGATGYLYEKKRTLCQYFTSYLKINMKWTLNLSMKEKTHKISRRKQRIFSYFRVENYFLISTKINIHQRKNEKLYCIKFKD